MNEGEDHGSSFQPLLSPESRTQQAKPLLIDTHSSDIVEEKKPVYLVSMKHSLTFLLQKSEEFVDDTLSEKIGRNDSAVSESELAPRRIFEINTQDYGDPERNFVSNQIRTTKYTCLTFLPKNLFEQFSKMANAYFTFLAAL